MAGSILKRAFGTRTMTRKDLQKLVTELDAIYKCVPYFLAFEDKRGYNIGKQFPEHLYKGGVYKELQDYWYSPRPGIHTLDRYNVFAGMAGCEWAAYQRARHPKAIVMRVYPDDRTAKEEHILFQLISSLICSFSTLVPVEFDKVDGLSKRNFEALAQGGAQGIEAGLEILESLPEFEVGGRQFLCIVDALNLAENKDTVADVKKLKAVLEQILARHNAHLLYTVAKPRKREEDFS
ncbi:hypothetical protein FHL15_007445 [Xylaria flabelliformis]|uniref:Uncharacterized protein n=1 Tax=Xylaria flabelliformis TaxID=2512241 RepID=A0A553HUP4_9PEZI|nr:hypothetical protein FHL15_007445 [Xylaria flabelliformis]